MVVLLFFLQVEQQLNDIILQLFRHKEIYQHMML
jgi:hypothetical protein